MIIAVLRSVNILLIFNWTSELKYCYSTSMIGMYF